MTTNQYLTALLGAVFSGGLGLLILTLLVKIVTKVFRIKTKRPSYITVISIFLFLGMIAYIRGIFVSNPQLPIIGQLISMVIYPAPVLMSAIGLWKMKKWGLLLLTGIMVLIQFFQLFAKVWTPMNLIYFILVVPAFIYFKKME